MQILPKRQPAKQPEPAKVPPKGLILESQKDDEEDDELISASAKKPSQQAKVVKEGEHGILVREILKQDGPAPG